MNKLRVYLSSGGRMASRCGLLAIAGALAAQTMPITREEAHSRAEALLRADDGRREGGPVEPGFRDPDSGAGKRKAGRCHRQRPSGLSAVALRCERAQPPAASSRGEVPAPYSPAHRLRCDPRLQDDFSGAAGHGVVMGSRLSKKQPSIRQAGMLALPGVQWTFTPMVDIARDARWGRIVEGAGEDPYLGAAMAAAQVRGFQGESIGPDSVLACVKHFAGYGAAEGGRDYDSSYIPETLFRNVYLVPFHAAEKAGAATFMSAYMDLNDVPASGNRWLLHDILRQEWGFQGFVVSDAFAVGNLETHGYARDPEDAAYKAFTAGLNMDMASRTYLHNLPKMVASGKITEAQLDAAVMPILEAKYQLGLFDHPYVDESKVDAAAQQSRGPGPGAQTGCPFDGAAEERQPHPAASQESEKVAVIGTLADSAKDIEGGWTVEGLFGGASKSHPVTVLAGLRTSSGPNVQINYVAGAAPTREYPSMMDAFTGAKTAAPAHGGRGG